MIALADKAIKLMSVLSNLQIPGERYVSITASRPMVLQSLELETLRRDSVQGPWLGGTKF